mmetsp:Transcript_51731/g.76682  ORF Transcript_51731/g.76682 Transcript_51731/m.76682 type:complete len:130 (+) Transcript_51731:36-425(+)|eukprot:CAMPEP_0195517820 /NCGR_PEP_ID=MMETSP0794_2-20130614/11756_1 /TAXON_ID=515487 /ORGANISM="Stephanopyxis turris, Strain CCMP 815" /LENGTH=129 /DNA_ID=CAMNT_0040646693 /DNA_START=34 /DNA_END=423 /DNA_ORIENTATION=-
MASSSLARTALGPLLRRSTVITRSSESALRGGGGYTPPVPPFARNLAPQDKLVEEHDLIWDDGVAPELTIDFDCQHVSKTEGLAWFLGGLGFFSGLYNLVALTDPAGKNPALNRRMNMVVDNPKTGVPE